MWLTNSSIGRKLVMSVTGAFLVLFVTFHCLMNGVALFWPSAYNVVCEFLGANWYALIGTLILALGFLLHIVYACWLTLQNRRARGNDRYAVTSKPKQVEWSSKNMLVLGLVILAFLVVHLIQFWAKMQLQEIRGEMYVDAFNTPVPPAAGTWFLQIAFGQWWTLLIYCIGFVALWFHMTHGFWSMFQSCGWNGHAWMDRLKTIGNWWTTIVIALFLAEAIVFTVQAHREAYTKCPALQVQYQEMMLEHQNGLTVGEPVPAMPGQPGVPPCQGPRCHKGGPKGQCPQGAPQGCPQNGPACGQPAPGQCPPQGCPQCPPPAPGEQPQPETVNE